MAPQNVPLSIEGEIDLLDADGEPIGRVDLSTARNYLISKRATRTRRNGNTTIRLVSDEEFWRGSRPLTLWDYLGQKYHFSEHFFSGVWCWSLMRIPDFERHVFLTSIIDVMPQHQLFNRYARKRSNSRDLISKGLEIGSALRAA